MRDEKFSHHEIKGKAMNTSMVMLVDSSNTYNFIDQIVVKRMGCSIQTISGIGVSIANGDRIWVHEVCKKVYWETEGLLQLTNFMALPLNRCDLILGVQWLKTLGSIIWDFTTLTIRFHLDNQQFILHGMIVGNI